MSVFIVLICGINVGGKSMPMAELPALCLKLLEWAEAMEKK